MDEQPRPDANGDERAYTLTIDEALHLYEVAGHPRTPRAIQKYCARGDLDCIKEDTEYGQRYRVTPTSAARHLAQIEEIKRANGRDHSRTDATVHSLETETHVAENPQATVRDQPRPDANVRPELEYSDRSRTAAPDVQHVAQLEKRLEEKDGEILFLRGELGIKNGQIKDLTERSRETNHLIAGLQKMLMPLLGRGTGAGERDASAVEE